MNLVSAWWLHRSESDSLNIRGAMLHLLADALGSVGAIVAAIVVMTVQWQAIDALVSALIGALILLSTLPLLRDSIKVLLQAAPAHIDIHQLREKIGSFQEVEEIADFHVWEINSGDVILSAILLTQQGDLEHLQDISDEIRQSICSLAGIEHATFEWRTKKNDFMGCSATTGHEEPPQDIREGKTNVEEGSLPE